MRGLLVELTRLRWRRAVLLLLVAAVVLPALLLAGTAWSTRPMSESDLDALLVDRYAQREVTRCERRPERFSDYSGEAVEPEGCREMIAGWYGGRQTLRPAQELDGTVLAASTLVLALVLLLGTTFVGHDWNTGSMSNQLLFEPRRGRVWATKAVAVTLTCLLLATAVLSAYWWGVTTLASVRDVAVADGVVGDGYEQALRTGVLAGATALGGYALTMLFRSTVATVGVLFGLAVASGALLGIVGQTTQRWTPPLNVMAVMQGQVTYYDESAIDPECRFGTAGPADDCDPERTLTAGDGGLYLGSALLLACGASVVSFRRRDVP